ncbi:MAG: class I SAM-dependent methyltransferase [Deltaproteobacteria bacterium]|nr:class I SAM-dependent methyltransferase [Deltaproteobacteria bacterium]
MSAAVPAPGSWERYLHSSARFHAEREIRAFLAGPARGRRVWDLGCGTPPLGAHPAALFTLDRQRSAGPTVVADLESMPFASGTIEGALLVAVLEHVDRPARVLAELARVMAPGAPAYVWVPFLHEVHEYPVDRWRFTPDGIRELLEDAGFATRSVAAGRLAGLGTVLAHLYRFLWPPAGRWLPLRRLGFRIVDALRIVDRAAPARDWPIGTTWIGQRR